MSSKRLSYSPCWLRYDLLGKSPSAEGYRKYFASVTAEAGGAVIRSAVEEITRAAREAFSLSPGSGAANNGARITLRVDRAGAKDAYKIAVTEDEITVTGSDEAFVLYGVFHLLRQLGCGRDVTALDGTFSTSQSYRIISHWDNADGSVERGYAGGSLFFHDDRLTQDFDRVRDYARLLASCGVNGIILNNSNVHRVEAELVTDTFLSDVAALATIFSAYGLRLYLSVNFAAPKRVGGLSTADPLEETVIAWWKGVIANIYAKIPDFGGFCVKADSEGEPGPFAYGRNHADGANLFARLLKPWGGIVIWRCFVYNCHMDWRDRSLDRAKAAFENFAPLDGEFDDHVVLLTKSGPMDFQIREPVSPLFGALKHTNQMMELQITQEYTGQQIHLCYLIPLWAEMLRFDTRISDEEMPAYRVVSGEPFGVRGGFAGIANVGLDPFWTGHPLAQANLYGFGRLAFDASLSPEDITREWISLTFGPSAEIAEKLAPMMLNSPAVYEKYNAPLGIGWMVTPSNHYGPSIDGYEYSRWGTYHYADLHGLGVDRTAETGTGYVRQYSPSVCEMYNRLETCPDELLLFFHHVPYTHVLHSGKTVIQHIYDTHFEGVEEMRRMIDTWKTLAGSIDGDVYARVLERLEEQLLSAVEWRDVVNAYFYRKSGIADAAGRKIY